MDCLAVNASRHDGHVADGENVVQPQQQEPPPEPAFVCSVLNTVVDHVMVPPTPLEPEEFAESQIPATIPKGVVQTAQLQVPVMRIFGSVVRRDLDDVLAREEDGTSSRSEPLPLQSACLYIHGAFPYLLARPRVAGPDGSLHRSCHRERKRKRPGSDSSDDEEPDAFVDWDDVQEVTKILPFLQDHLETALQSSFQDFGGGTESGTATTSGRQQASVRIIRRLSVVVGRGFYTYCPGPPAPFLRVEYYQPTLRWKVKRILERGLDVPRRYHPDPVQYRATPVVSASPGTPLAGVNSKNNGNDDDNNDKLLQFHCYEAHIPYTMQFFKDYNLAGLSYVHVGVKAPEQGCKSVIDDTDPDESDSHDPLLPPPRRRTKRLVVSARRPFVQFRHPLPLSVRLRWPCPTEAPVKGHECTEFLSSNTPDRYLWPRDERQGPSNDKICTTPVEFKPPPSHPSTEKNGLLPPDEEDDPWWLYHLQQPSQQDSPQSDASPLKTDGRDMGPVATGYLTSDPAHEVSSHQSRRIDLAAAEPISFEQYPWGAWCAKETSCDVEIDITVEAIRNVDDVMTDLPGSDEDRQKIHWRAVPSLREIWREERRRMAKLLPPQHDFLSASTPDTTSDVVRSESGTPPFTLSVKNDGVMPGARLARQGMDALVGLTQGLRDDFRRVMNDIVNRHSASVSHVDAVLARQIKLEGNPNDATNPEVPTLTPTSTSVDSASGEREKFECTPSFDETLEALGALGRIDDFKTPGTLYSQTPVSAPLSQSSAQLIDTGSRLLSSQESGSRFQVMSQSYYEPASEAVASPLEEEFALSQRIERGDPIVEGGFDCVEDFIDPETLTPFDFAEEDDNEMEDMEVEEFENVLATLATQAENQEYSSNSREVDDESVVIVDGFFGSKPSQDEIEPTHAPTPLPAPAGSLRHGTGAKAQNLPSLWTHEANAAIIPRLVPPKHDQVSCGESILFPMNSASIPGWLNWATDVTVESKRGSCWFPRVPPGGIHVTSLANPPARRKVQEWQNLQKVHSNGPVLEPIGTNGDKGVFRPAELPLEGIGNQGGRIWIEGGGNLKAKTRASQAATQRLSGTANQDSRSRSDYLRVPVTLMSLEVHVQCRTGRAGVADSKTIAMTPDPSRDKVYAVVFVFARDPGGGDAVEILEQGCVFVPVQAEISDEQKREDHTASGRDLFSRISQRVRRSLPRTRMGKASAISVECVEDEIRLLLRISSIVRWKDPDMLVSWDSQGAGIGYLVERGALAYQHHDASGQSGSTKSVEIDMSRLLGRTPAASGGLPLSSNPKAVPMTSPTAGEPSGSVQWKGSGLGTDWDERVGAGAAAASIVSKLCHQCLR
jgi:hypothetical protein